MTYFLKEGETIFRGTEDIPEQVLTHAGWQPFATSRWPELALQLEPMTEAQARTMADTLGLKTGWDA